VHAYNKRVEMGIKYVNSMKPMVLNKGHNLYNRSESTDLTGSLVAWRGGEVGQSA